MTKDFVPNDAFYEQAQENSNTVRSMLVVNQVAAERERQKHIEGWTPENDDGYTFGEIAKAASYYATYASGKMLHRAAVGMREDREAPEGWPWAAEWWKPTTRRRDLIKAAAFIVAEIERLDREASND